MSNFEVPAFARGNLKVAVKSFAHLIEHSVPPGNERETALLKLREAYLWAVEGIDKIEEQIRDSKIEKPRKVIIPKTSKEESLRYAYRHKFTGKISYKSHPYGYNHILQRAKEHDLAGAR